MHIIPFFLVCLLIGIFLSCSNISPLEQALNYAGSNRPELEKVLNHYKHDSLKYITGRMNSPMSTPSTSVSLFELEKDFGVIPLTDIREHVFKLVNKGNKPLVIYDVVTSCGCTKAEYSKEPIRPGETLDLKVIYNAEDKVFFP